MSEPTPLAQPARRLLPGWLTMLLAMMPELGLVWLIYSQGGKPGYLIAASVVLCIAGIILTTQRRTRWIGAGLLVGFAVWILCVVAPMVLLILGLMFCGLTDAQCIRF